MCGQHQCNTHTKSAEVININKQYGSSPLIWSMQLNDGYFQLIAGAGLLYDCVKVNGGRL